MHEIVPAVYIDLVLVAKSIGITAANHKDKLAVE
jgi:hypothetical protein